MAANSDSEPSASDVISDKIAETTEQPQVPAFSGFSAHADKMMLPVMYPALIPGFLGTQSQEEMNRRPGIYAVPVLPGMGQLAVPSNMFIPFTYSVPTSSSTLETEVPGGEPIQWNPQPEEQIQWNQIQQRQQQQQQQVQNGPQLAAQRQIVVRRFQIAFQLDLLLMVKLAFVVFLFNQDGSRQRLALLVFLASLVYLYQTGALAPLTRWLSQAMHRAAAPPRPPRPAVRADPAVGAGNENAAAEEIPREENNQQPAGGANGSAENEAAPEAGADGGNYWWGIAKEIQVIVFGFISSLLPGFHNMDLHEA